MTRKSSASRLVSTTKRSPQWSIAVLDVVLAGAHRSRRGVGIGGGISHASLVCLLDDSMMIHSPLRDSSTPEEEALVELLVDQHVVGLRRCRPRGATPGTAASARRASCRTAACRRPTTPRRPTPSCPRGRRRGRRRSCRSRILHGVLLAAVRVARSTRAACDRGLVVEHAEREVVAARRPRRSRRARRARRAVSRVAPATVDRVAQALLGPAGVPPAAVEHRHRDVGLLHARLDLLEQRLGELGVLPRTTRRSTRSRPRGRRSCPGRRGRAATPTGRRRRRSGGARCAATCFATGGSTRRRCSGEFCSGDVT